MGKDLVRMQGFSDQYVFQNSSSKNIISKVTDYFDTKPNWYLKKVQKN